MPILAQKLSRIGDWGGSNLDANSLQNGSVLDAIQQAIPADTKVASFAVLKDDALCSIEVTEQTINTWYRDVTNIEDAINSLQSAKDHAENILDQALADLDEAYENSSGFKGYVPSEDISVYGALEEMGANDLEYAFRRSLEEMYKFQMFKRLTAY